MGKGNDKSKGNDKGNDKSNNNDKSKGGISHCVKL